MNLHQWSWLFLAVYIGLMVLFGLLGQRRVSNADDFAVARQSYGPLVLALAFASTAASGLRSTQKVRIPHLRWAESVRSW